MSALVAGSRAATADDWTRFLRPIAAAVRNTPSEGEFRARVAAVAMAVNVPADWLRQPWRQAEAMRRFQFWPAVADVAELFAPDLLRIREAAERRGRLAAPSDLPAGPRERTAAEVQAVQQTARAFAAEVAARDMGRDRTPPKAAPVSDGALLALYERAAAEGNQAAAFRAEQLRARIAETAAHG